MQAIISAEQGRKILNGREPLVPVEYEVAIKALQDCSTFEEAKYWSDKSEALAAWAKIYHSDKAILEAKRLKLHAYRRMGELANELRPIRQGLKGKRGGAGPGKLQLLIEGGLTKNNAHAATFLGRMPKETFEKIVSTKNPLSPATCRALMGLKSSSSYNSIASGAISFRSLCRNMQAYDCARALHKEEVGKARSLIYEIYEWCDAFLQALPSE